MRYSLSALTAVTLYPFTAMSFSRNVSCKKTKSWKQNTMTYVSKKHHKFFTFYAKNINKEKPLLKDIFTNIMMMGKDELVTQP